MAGAADEGNRVVVGPEAAPEEELPAITDASGTPLCSHALWGRRCRWGKKCSFSHAVPEDVAAAYKQRGSEQVLQTARRRMEEAPPVDIPRWLQDLQATQQRFAFNAASFGLREALCQVFQVTDPLVLSQLHTQCLDNQPPLCTTLLQSLSAVHGMAGLPEAWQIACKNLEAHRADMVKSEAFKNFLDAYDKFCSCVVVPLVGDTAAYVQRPPSLRVHLAGQAQASGKIGMHRDSDYAGHVEAEVNFWLPITDVSGTNSLYVESRADAGDFIPLDMTYGEVYRFHGYSCRHHTAANDSGVTRVSLDLRAVPVSCCSPAALMGGRRGARGMRIGDYGVVVAHAVDELRQLPLCVDGEEKVLGLSLTIHTACGLRRPKLT
eukprot:TRINITY_DN80198_c0_g1_i1.p1 TRINITY_DN80198_c0_g1~~TRINITY_DN80198_c0_g1_i1.p1  ORF type:complete len:378 (-),score=27.28 TRINITY_DN80198_c0_g1_i1:57-1190(-)